LNYTRAAPWRSPRCLWEDLGEPARAPIIADVAGDVRTAMKEPTVPENPHQQQPGPEAPYGSPAGSGQPYNAPGAGEQPYGYPQGGPAGYPHGGPAGYPQGAPSGYPGGYDPNLDPAAKSRLAAGLLGILLGSLGIHRFYLGHTGIGLLMLLLSVLSVGFLAPLVGIWGLVEGILYLTAKQGTYAVDATGRPLRA
jgi:TM2 domain-containing membrane protein YozV